MTNPLLFLVQVLLPVLTTTASASTVQTKIIATTLRYQQWNRDQEPQPHVLNLSTPHDGASTASTVAMKGLLHQHRRSGHVGWHQNGIMTNPLLFLVQVGDDYSTVKTSNRCFIQLTCPNCLHAFINTRDLALSLLLLCGDIELNPGPSTQELHKQLLDGQKLIQERLDAIESKLQKGDSIEKSVQCLEKRLVDLGDRSRRNNLIVFGIPESENESTDALNDKVVTDLFKSTLGVDVHSVERLHRMGRR